MKNAWSRLTVVRRILFVCLAVMIIFDAINLVFAINDYSGISGRVMEAIACFGTVAVLVPLFVLQIRNGLRSPTSVNETPPPAGRSD